MMVPKQSISAPLTLHWHPDSTWSFASQLLSAQFSRRIVAWRCVAMRFLFCNFKVHWSTTPADPCVLSEMFGTKNTSNRKYLSENAKQYRLYMTIHCTDQHTLVQRSPGVPDAAHLVETVPVPSHDDVGAVPLAPAQHCTAKANTGWRPARRAKIGQTNLPKDLQSGS